MKKTFLAFVSLILFLQCSIAQLPHIKRPVTVAFCGVDNLIFTPDKSKIYYLKLSESSTECVAMRDFKFTTSECDKFSFVFAGYYQQTNTPIYFLKRIDGKYLTYQIGGTGFISSSQIPIDLKKWIIFKAGKGFRIACVSESATHIPFLGFLNDRSIAIVTCEERDTKNTIFYFGSEPGFKRDKSKDTH